MKTIVTFLFLLISNFSYAQFEGNWYAFRTKDLYFNTFTKDKLIIGRIANYNSDKEYVATEDTITIENRILKNDSILYIITNKDPDDLKFDSKELQIHKFMYHKDLNILTSYFFNPLKQFVELESKTKNIETKDIKKFISKDNSSINYLVVH